MEQRQIDICHDGQNLGPNQHLIGKEARYVLNTPSLILDMAVFDRNLSMMADYAKAANISLRPHVKCHKSVGIAKRQVEAGAIGVCCATLGEAETMCAAGIDNILITSPVTTSEKIKRFQTLSQKLEWIAVVVDNSDNAQALSRAAVDSNQKFQVLVDIDPGMHRTGVASAEATIALALECDALPGLNYAGLQCYAGLAQHIQEYEERKAFSYASVSCLEVILAELKERGLETGIVTGGGTGTFDIDAEFNLFTELQVGSYIFMDTQYNCLEHVSSRPVFEQSLFVQAAVCSANHEGFATVDAGLKQFSLDSGIPEIAGENGSQLEFLFMGDEHGKVVTPPNLPSLNLGDRVEFIVPHCDPTVNLYNQIHCFRGDTLEGIWAVDARGK